MYASHCQHHTRHMWRTKADGACGCRLHTQDNLTVLLDNSVDEYGVQRISLYCTHWIINRTGLGMLFRTFDNKYLAGQRKQIAMKWGLAGDPAEWYTEEVSQPLLYSVSSASKIFQAITATSLLSLKIANSEWTEAIDISAEEPRYATCTATTSFAQ